MPKVDSNIHMGFNFWECLKSFNILFYTDRVKKKGKEHKLFSTESNHDIILLFRSNFFTNYNIILIYIRYDK